MAQDDRAGVSQDRDVAAQIGDDRQAFDGAGRGALVDRELKYVGDRHEQRLGGVAGMFGVYHGVGLHGQTDASVHLEVQSKLMTSEESSR